MNVTFDIKGKSVDLSLVCGEARHYLEFRCSFSI